MNPQQQFEVELPAGGHLALRTQDEVDLWEELHEKYVKDYGLAKANDLALLGAVLSQHIAMFRAQQKLNGMIPETDNNGVPTGRYIVDPKHKAADSTAAQTQITKASTEIREMEKALGIDKKTREAGGQFNVADYIGTLKRVGHMMGIHITQRVRMSEAFMTNLSWRIRLLRNGDDEDKAYHGITEASIIEFCEAELAKMDSHNKKFARKQAVFAGKL